MEIKNQKVSFFIMVYCLGAIISFNYGMEFKSGDAPKLSTVAVKQEPLPKNETPFSEDSLVALLKELNFDHPHVILAQAKLETGHFTSTIFKENNNLFGMKKAYTRPTTAIGVNRGHAVYRNWKDSVIDYALYQSYFGRNKQEKDYYKHLDKYYAQDPLYSEKLKSVINSENLNLLF